MRPNNHGGGNNNFNRRRNNNGSQGNRGGNSGGGNNNFNRRPQQPQNLRNQIFDSHGPNGERVRGNAFQVFEKYQSLARDAEERVDQEAYGQFAEHYYRIIEAIQELEAERNARFAPQQQGGNGYQGQVQGQPQGGDSDNRDPFAPLGEAGTDGEQPDLNGDTAQPPRMQRQDNRQDHRQDRQSRGDRPRFERHESGRDGNRETVRDNGPEGARDMVREGVREGGRDNMRDSNREGAAVRGPRRAPVSMESALEAQRDDEREQDDSGPSFSLTDKPAARGSDPDIGPDGAEETAVAETPAPRRRGRPAKVNKDAGE